MNALEWKKQGKYPIDENQKSINIIREYLTVHEPFEVM